MSINKDQKYLFTVSSIKAPTMDDWQINKCLEEVIEIMNSVFIMKLKVNGKQEVKIEVAL